MTALHEQAIHLIAGMPTERLCRALAVLHSMEDDVSCAKLGEEAAPSRGTPSIEDDRRRRLIALFGSITDETFCEHLDLPFSLDAERVAL